MKSIYLPYCPGIPWTINDNQVIVRKLNGSADKLLTNNLNIICHGGLLETFLSSFAIEYLHYKYPSKSINWHGSYEFKDILRQQGIASISGDITQDIAESYPIPMFKDRDNNTYFNLLDNYFDYSTYLGKKIKKNKINFIDTINKNFMIANLLEHPLKFRTFNHDPEFESWCKLNKNILNKPYMLILPDRLTTSLHHLDFIKFSMMELRALSSVLASKGVQLIVMSEDPSKYHGTFKFIKYSFNRFMSLSQNARFILSRQPDFSLISLFISKAHVYSHYVGYMPKVKLKPTIRRVRKENFDSYMRYLPRTDTLSFLIDDISRRLYGY